MRVNRLQCPRACERKLPRTPMDVHTCCAAAARASPALARVLPTPVLAPQTQTDGKPSGMRLLPLLMPLLLDPPLPEERSRRGAAAAAAAAAAEAAAAAPAMPIGLEPRAVRCSRDARRIAVKLEPHIVCERGCSVLWPQGLEAHELFVIQRGIIRGYSDGIFGTQQCVIVLELMALYLRLLRVTSLVSALQIASSLRWTFISTHNHPFCNQPRE
jgi:hypothetical protein